MKILFLTQFLPFYPNTGGKLKTWQILKILSKKNQVYLISFVDSPQDLDGLSEVKRHCFKVKTVVNPIITQAHTRLKLKFLLSFFSLSPFRVTKHYSSLFLRLIKEALIHNQFDIVYFDHDVMLQYLPLVKKLSNAKLVFDEHDLTSEGTWQTLRAQSNYVYKLGYFIETLKWLHYERKFFPKCDLIFTISPQEQKQLTNKGILARKIIFLPTPLPQHHLLKRRVSTTNSILLVGLMSWKPNSDGFWWFYRYVYPLVKKEIPDVSLDIVGAFPSTDMIELSKNDPSLNIKGYQKNLTPIFKKASVFIVPIRIGSGIRIKLLESMSRGVPVVSTSIGASGVKVRHNQQLLIADNPEKFARSVIRIIRNKILATRLSKNGYQFVRQNYHQSSTAKILTKLSMLR